MSDEPQKTRRGQFVRRRPLPPDALAYRVPEAAAVIGISKSTLWEMIAEGKIEARKIGAATVIRRTALEAYMDGTPVRGVTPKPATEGQGTP